MENLTKTQAMLLEHYEKYPALQLRDLFKYLYQSAFGCEHLVTSLEAATEYIRRERQELPQDCTPALDPLDGDYSRVSLTWVKAETLGRLFFLSAQASHGGNLEKKLTALAQLIDQGKLPFSREEFAAAHRDWQAAGYPAIHHSDAFRAHYTPSYRVILRDFVPFLPLLARLEEMLEQGSVVLAIEGGSASGKTTLSGLLEKLYDCTVFHMDDFFLQPHQRTPERYAQPGENIDWERFLEEVLLPLKAGKPVTYRKFDCSTQTLGDGITVLPGKLTVIEGAYSMHPSLAPYYGLSVFLDVDPQLQKRRIQNRNSPEMAELFFHRWIPLETAYFSRLQPKDRCDLTIPIE